MTEETKKNKVETKNAFVENRIKFEKNHYEELFKAEEVKKTFDNTLILNVNKRCFYREIADIKIMIMTVNEIERRTLFACFTDFPSDSDLVKKNVIKRIPYKGLVYSIFYINDIKVVHVEPEMTGSNTKGGTYETLRKALKTVRPTYVISLGVGFGFDIEKEALCDVMVGRQFFSYDKSTKIKDNELGVEPFYALAKLAKELKIISRTELQQIESAIKKLLRNDGKYTFESVDIALCTKLINPPKNTKEQFSSNVKTFLEQFRSIFTTNYDCLLEDFTDKEIGHLHGTFDISKNILRQKSNNRFDWNVNEDIILGFDADEKEENITHLGVNNLNKHYLNKLASSNIDEIHFLGYSGINDQHINESILKNSKLKKIVYYGDPNSINDPNCEYEEYIKYCLGIKTHNANIKLIIKSWNEVWNKLYVL